MWRSMDSVGDGYDHAMCERRYGLAARAAWPPPVHGSGSTPNRFVSLAEVHGGFFGDAHRFSGRRSRGRRGAVARAALTALGPTYSHHSS